MALGCSLSHHGGSPLTWFRVGHGDAMRGHGPCGHTAPVGRQTGSRCEDGVLRAVVEVHSGGCRSSQEGPPAFRWGPWEHSPCPQGERGPRLPTSLGPPPQPAQGAQEGAAPGLAGEVVGRRPRLRQDVVLAQSAPCVCGRWAGDSVQAAAGRAGLGGMLAAGTSSRGAAPGVCAHHLTHARFRGFGKVGNSPLPSTVAGSQAHGIG